MASASRRARAWSSARRSRPVSRATRPAAAMIPACRQAPPYRIQMRRASRISSAGPHSIEPIGAPSPFERQNIIVSTCEVHAVTGSPVAAAAFHSRAPSRWIGTPAPSVIARTSRSSSERQDRAAGAADRVLDREQVDDLDVEVVVGLEQAFGQRRRHVAVRVSRCPCGTRCPARLALVMISVVATCAPCFGAPPGALRR